MRSVGRSASLGSWALFAAAMQMAAVGCTGRQSTEQRLQKALEQAGEKKEIVFPLSGRVLVDGEPAAFDPRSPVIVILIDREKSAEPASSHRFDECDPEGQFFFSTYARDDGIKPGRYVVAIAKFLGTGPREYTGPDQFHNRYNDPDKNAQEAMFQIEHNAPGKRDYEFHLTVAGAQPVDTPGPYAITQLP
jgi:hypothetical protein